MSLSQINQNFSNISDVFNGAVELFKKQSTPIQVLVGVAALAAIGAVTALFVGLVNKIRNWNAEVVVIDPAKVDESNKTNEVVQKINQEVQEISKVATSVFDKLSADVANTSTEVEARLASAKATIELKVADPVKTAAKEAANKIAEFATSAEDALAQLNTAHETAGKETASSTEKADAAVVVNKSSQVIANASEEINKIFEAFKAKEAEIQKDQATLTAVLKEKAHAESKNIINIAYNNPVTTTVAAISAGVLALPFMPVAFVASLTAGTIATAGLTVATLATGYNAIKNYNNTYVAPVVVQAPAPKVETPVVPADTTTPVVATEEKAADATVPATKKAA